MPTKKNDSQYVEEISIGELKMAMQIQLKSIIEEFERTSKKKVSRIEIYRRPHGEIVDVQTRLEL